MRLALNDAGLEPSQISHINMHGTSTPNGDAAESAAIETVFGDHASSILCNSTKSMTGHLLGAAGAMEALIALMSLQKGIIPPTINLDHQDPNCRLNYCANKAVKFSGEYALSNSFGFGGTNGALVMKRFV
jgi:3-oxoacyl-[acyl-carrier-protein] synthase II